MQIIKADTNLSPKDCLDSIDIQALIHTFEISKSFIYPTDTVYGLGVNALDETAVEHLFSVKKRPKNKAVPIIVRGIDMAHEFAYIEKGQEKILKKIWPGAATAIFKRRSNISRLLTGGENTVGLRVPNSNFALGLMDILDHPLTATSANISDSSPTHFSKEIINMFERACPSPHLFFDAGDLADSNPSTVIDMTGEEPVIVRMGPISKKDLGF